MKNTIKLSEHIHQSLFFEWLQAHNIIGFAIPNAGKRSPRLAKYMKSEGLRAGILDCQIVTPIPINPKGYRGLFIEFKTPERKNEKNGGLSPKQILWINTLTRNRYLTYVAYGYDDAVKFMKSLGY